MSFPDGEDYYALLGARKTASQDEIERLYKRLARQHHPDRGLHPVVPPLSPPSAQLPNTISGRLIGASLFLLAGLVFLFLVRIYYIRFMWPIFLAAAVVVILGVRKLHAVMTLARKDLAPSHSWRRHVWVQELAFWIIVSGGAYGTYLLMRWI